MRRVLLAVTIAILATTSFAAVVVLKGGKKLEVASYEQKGNYVVVTLPDGRKASYPLAAVDLGATAKANTQSEPAPAAAKPEPPRSPFARAVAKPGTPAMFLTDADVQKVAPVGGEETGAEGTVGETPVREEGVVVLGWSGRELGEGKWEILANLVNQGKVPVQNVAVAVRGVVDGTTVGTGSATYPGTVQPGQQFTVPVTLSSPQPPKQVVFSLNWQQLTPLPVPTPSAPTPVPEAQPSPGGGGS